MADSVTLRGVQDPAPCRIPSLYFDSALEIAP